MKDAFALQEAILAELRDAGSALSTCIVVTAIADNIMLAKVAEEPVATHAGAGRMAADVGAESIGIKQDFDGYSGLLSAARQSMGEARSFGTASRAVDAKAAMANAIRQVLLSLAGRSIGGQEHRSPMKKKCADLTVPQRQTSATTV
jgi:hypothetical protein